jgi:hypothetical protein
VRRILPIKALLLLLSGLSALTSPQFFARHDVHNHFNGVRSLYVEDVDGDGDIDVLSAAYHNDQVYWWENTGGTPLPFAHHHIRHKCDGADSVHAGDPGGTGLSGQRRTTLQNAQENGHDNTKSRC